MVAHSTLTGSELHEPKGVASAASGTVYVANGSGSGTWTDITPSLPETIVVVNTLSDFPTPVSSVITLANNTAYWIDGTVDILTNRIEYGTNSIMFGTHQTVAGITSTTTSPLITANNVNIYMNDITLSCASGDAFDFNGSGSESMQLIRVKVSTCVDYGAIDQASAIRFDSCSFLTSSADGFTFTGAGSDFYWDRNFVSGFTGTALDLSTSTWSRITIENCRVITTTSRTGFTFAASEANLATGGFGQIRDNIINTSAGGTAYSGLDTAADSGIDATGNVGIPDTIHAAQGYITGNATATTFGGTGSGNEVVVAFGTGFLSDVAPSDWTISNAGRFTYNGDNDRTFMVSIPMSASIGGGAARTYNFYIAKNGTIIASSINQRTFDGTNSGALSVDSVVSVTKNDYIELYARAETAATNLTVGTASITITKS